MGNTIHEQIIGEIKNAFTGSVDIHKLEYPTQPLIGVYKPDFIWYVKESPVWEIALIGEVECTNFANKDIIGACVLADHLCCRHPEVPKPSLIFVVPDNTSPNDISHIEERINIAVPRMKKLRILPTKKVSDFKQWFKQYYESYTISKISFD